MKRFLLEFLRRGSVVSGFGPLVLAVVYLALKKQGLVNVLEVDEVCLGIVSLFALAFVVGGMNAIYQIERLPLMAAVSIHGGVLYISYLSTYLLNDWLELGGGPVLVFTGIFVFGYLLIWAIIYSVIKKSTDRINDRLRKEQGSTER